MLVLTGLIIGPLLGFMDTGVKTGQAHEEEMLRLYASDAGVEYALWHLAQPGPAPSRLRPPMVNEKVVEVKIEGVWILDGIQPETTPGQGITVTGKVKWIEWRQGHGYQIRITTPSDISVARLGVWLPHGFSYAGHTWAHHAGRYEKLADPSLPPRSARGGIILVWDFSPPRAVFAGDTYVDFRIDPAVDSPGDFVWLITSKEVD
jgi:hypothetical protein